MAKEERSGKICRRSLAAFAVLLTMGGQASGATNSLTMGLENRYSDNVTRDAVDEKSDLETRLNLKATHQSDPGTCSSSLDAGLGYGYWHDDSFDPQLYTNGRFNGRCELGRGLEWQVQNTISQVTQNSRQADTPDNTTRKNVFQTGPVYSIRLTEVDMLRFSLSYINTEFEEPEEPDSNSVSGNVSYNHSFSPTFQGGLSAGVERTELDTTEELDRESATLTFNKSWATTSISGAVGGNRLTTRLGALELESDGTTGNLTLTRELTPTSRLILNASRQLTNQTSTIGVEYEDFSFNLTDTSAVEVSVVSLSLNTSFSSGASLSSRVEASRSDYIRSGNREQKSGLTIRYNRPVTSLLSFSSDLSYRYIKFEDDGSDDQVISGSVGADYSLSRNLSLRSSVGHQQRVNDFANREYQENWIAISLNYQFL